jgi:hypothetical protein
MPDQAMARGRDRGRCFGRDIETVVLLSAEDIDRAIAKNAPYRAPGA